MEPELIEKGDVAFVYVPRVEHPLVHSLEEVQCFYVLLRPGEGGVCRRIQVGRKRLPEPGNPKQRFWAYVQRVGALEEVTHDLEGGVYVTRTRGLRHQPPARPAGSGTYALARHDDHTHFSYALDLPATLGPAQRALGLAPVASHIVAVMNPERPSGARRIGRAFYPGPLQERFGERRYAPVDPPEFLDHRGAELVFIGSRGAERCAMGPHLARAPDELLASLQLPRTAALRRPLVFGQWS